MKDFEIRDCCPECGSANIANWGVDKIEMDEAVYLVEKGECYDCGCAWTDNYELASTEIDKG